MRAMTAMACHTVSKMQKQALDGHLIVFGGGWSTSTLGLCIVAGRSGLGDGGCSRGYTIGVGWWPMGSSGGWTVDVLFLMVWV